MNRGASDNPPDPIPTSAALPVARLRIDAATFADLEVFSSETGGASLFDLCNECRTDGGAQVLRRRMEQPWAAADPIRRTQASLTFITAQRPAFDVLPSAYTINRVARYEREPLPAVTQQNLLGFAAAAFALWADDDSRYVKILNGVQFTREFIGALRRFAGQPALTGAEGEVAPIVGEMRTLLARPRLVWAAQRGSGGWFFTRLRFDQVFRRHEKAAIRRLVELVHELDALMAMADVTERHGFVLPGIEAGPPRVHGEGLVHPRVDGAVANSVSLDAQRRVLFLTGPNMAGKTTYLRAIAIALYFAHLGMGVPARKLGFVPLQRLFTSISLSDDLHGGVSYFRAEALRIKAIAQSMAAGERVAALLDEPFKGTNVKDAMDASLAVLERFARSDRCLFVFSSHLIELGDQVTDGRIDYRHFEAQERGGRLSFDFKLRPGISAQRLGMRVLREEGVFDLLDRDVSPEGQVPASR